MAISEKDGQVKFGRQSGKKLGKTCGNATVWSGGSTLGYSDFCFLYFHNGSGEMGWHWNPKTSLTEKNIFWNVVHGMICQMCAYRFFLCKRYSPIWNPFKLYLLYPLQTLRKKDTFKGRCHLFLEDKSLNSQEIAQHLTMFFLKLVLNIITKNLEVFN